MFIKGQVIDDMEVLSYEGKTSNWIKIYKVKCLICGYEKNCSLDTTSPCLQAVGS